MDPQNPVRVKVELEDTEVVSEGVVNVKDLGGQIKVKEEPLCFPEANIEGSELVAAQELNTENGNVLSNAAVVEARRLAAPRQEARWANRRIYRKGGREKHGVDRDSENLLNCHRGELRDLLGMLSRERKWYHMSGVLGVLLGIPHESLTPAALAGRWSDFSAALEVLKRVDCGESNDVRVRRMFRVLSLQQPNPKLRAKVQLELSLYLIGSGDREAAYNELRPIVDGKHHREDPVANLCHGLNSYHLWYEKAVDEVARQIATSIGSGLECAGLPAEEGIGENSAPEADNHTTYPEWTKTPLQGLRDPIGSRAAIQLEWGQSQLESNAQGMEIEVTNWDASQRSIYEETDEQGFVQSGEEFWSTVTVPWSSRLNRQLFPIKTLQDLEQKHYVVPMLDGRTRDLHSAAVKHLKQALLSAPDLLPALLPLVQLLLAVHDIKGAVHEIDKCSRVLPKHYIPPSIKVKLLESLDKKDPIQLATGYRDVLNRNPLSFSSLESLVKLHSSGYLETELLLECICLHLDVCPGAVDTWEKLASCLLELAERPESSFSGDINLKKRSREERMEEGLRHPTSLSRDNLRRLWSSRYRWWLRKHFNAEFCGNDHVGGGDQWLLAYKAACAAHIYGSGVYFVEQARKTLKEKIKEREFRLVDYHCERALELFRGP